MRLSKAFLIIAMAAVRSLHCGGAGAYLDIHASFYMLSQQ
jgi:hypothetical protein